VDECSQYDRGVLVRTVIASAILTAALIATACGGSSGCSTSVTTSLSVGRSTTSSAPTGTTINVVQLELSWSPADALPAEDEEKLNAALEQGRLRMLLPSSAPVSGSVAARLSLYRSAPSLQHSSVLTLYLNDEPLGLLSISTSSAPPMELDGSPVQVRGLTGEVLIVPQATCFLQWHEDGQVYVVDFHIDQLSVEQLVAWLAEWRRLP
jgi:hypothetical protein